MVKDKILQRGKFQALSPMQEDVMTSSERHIVLLSPTGSGKTVAFLGFLMRHLKPGARQIQALIVAPSRELAQQISGVFKSLAHEYRTVTVYGGRPLRDEVNILESVAPEILIATPGRLLDHLQRGSVDLKSVRLLVIDEMDKCLDLGFAPDIKRILKKSASAQFIILTSATMPKDDEIIKFTENFKLMDYREENENAPDIEIVEIPSADKDKLLVLKQLLDTLPLYEKSIVFVNHRESADRVFESLKKEGYPVTIYHGGMEQQDREISLATFANGTTPILIATDLAARGLDIEAVNNVIHYHLPTSAEAYTHRNGRTARAGASGTALILVSPADSLPDYIKFDRTWQPMGERAKKERKLENFSLILNSGKRDKISRGDILGFLTKDEGIPAEDIGKITVGERYAVIAMKDKFAEQLKGKIVRIKGAKRKFI